MIRSALIGAARGLLALALALALVGCRSCPTRTSPNAAPRESPEKKLAPLKPRAGDLPSYEVQMIAGYGMWPPMDAGDVKERVAEAHADRAGVMVVDTGLTERWQAYQAPEPYYEIVSGAVAEGRRLGLGQVFYFPAFELRREKAAKGAKHKKSLLELARPWAQITLAGDPFYKTRFGKQEFWNEDGDEVLWVCPHSPWRRAFFQRMREVVRRGVRYVFVDVPYFQMAGKHVTCGCDHCKLRFKKETGLELPSTAGPGTAAQNRWLVWRHRALLRFLGDLRRALRDVSPEAKLVVEEYPSYLDLGTNFTGLDMGLAGPEVDIFAHEYSAKQFDKRPFSRKDRLALAATLGLYRGLDDHRPSWVLSYAHDVNGSRVNVAFHLLMDASFWETRAPEMSDATVSRPWRRRLFRWFARHRGWFGSARQAAAVAVLYSPPSRDFSTAHFRTLRQVLLRLTAARVPHRVLSTRDLHRVGDYETVILPAVKCLDARHAARLRGAKKTRLISVGAAPSHGPLGLEKVDHRLKLHPATMDRLPQAVGPLPVVVQGGEVVANLLQRRGELQLRLANLRDSPALVRVSLQPTVTVTGASALPLLGQERKLKLERGGKTITFRVAVKDLIIVRLRTRTGR